MKIFNSLCSLNQVTLQIIMSFGSFTEIILQILEKICFNKLEYDNKWISLQIIKKRNTLKTLDLTLKSVQVQFHQNNLTWMFTVPNSSRSPERVGPECNSRALRTLSVTIIPKIELLDWNT